MSSKCPDYELEPSQRDWKAELEAMRARVQKWQSFAQLTGVERANLRTAIELPPLKPESKTTLLSKELRGLKAVSMTIDESEDDLYIDMYYGQIQEYRRQGMTPSWAHYETLRKLDPELADNDPYRPLGPKYNLSATCIATLFSGPKVHKENLSTAHLKTCTCGGHKLNLPHSSWCDSGLGGAP